MEMAPHIGFIAAAYAASIIVIGALIAWVMFDYRLQRRILAELEAQGIARRSAPGRESTGQPARENV